MKADPIQKAKIGMFTVVGILLLIAGVFIVGRKKNMFTDTFEVYGLFKSVGGLQIGNNIRFAGINVGTVQNIQIVSDTVIKVDMILQKRVHDFIKSTAIASIGSDGLMGDKLITISPGTATGQKIASGGRINTVNPIEYDKLIKKATAIVDNTGIVVDGLADIVTQIKSGEGSLGRLVYKDNLSQSLEQTVNATKKTMITIDSGAKGFSENMKGIRHNILLKGYFKRKEKKEEQRREERENKAATDTTKKK